MFGLILSLSLSSSLPLTDFFGWLIGVDDLYEIRNDILSLFQTNVACGQEYRRRERVITGLLYSKQVPDHQPVVTFVTKK